MFLRAMLAVPKTPTTNFSDTSVRNSFFFSANRDSSHHSARGADENSDRASLSGERASTAAGPSHTKLERSDSSMLLTPAIKALAAKDAADVEAAFSRAV